MDEDAALNDLLLSRRAKKSQKEFMICQSCKTSLIDNKNVSSPPRFSIVNGFVIGYIPLDAITEVQTFSCFYLTLCTTLKGHKGVSY